ncbi:methionine biosynthesis protein MetW, partial [Chromobacterium phragmitis]
MEGLLRPDLRLIADWISPHSRVLDLGCGDAAHHVGDVEVHAVAVDMLVLLQRCSPSSSHTSAPPSWYEARRSSAASGTRPDCVPDAALDLLASYQDGGAEV